MVNTKKTVKQSWYKLQVYLPPETKKALDSYVAEKYRPGSRVLSAIAVKALDCYLGTEGFPVEQGGADDEVAENGS